MIPTKHTSFIPMTPNAKPKQRLNEVVEIPDKPDDLNVLIHWKDPILAKTILEALQESSPLYAASSGRGHPCITG